MKIENFHGYENREIKVFIDIEEASKIFMIYPGMSYGINYPFFYYFIKLLKSREYGYIFFEYDWKEIKNIMTLPDDQIDKILIDEIDKSFHYLDGLQLKNLSFLGKSIGTKALERFCEVSVNYEIKIEKYFWITPFLNLDSIAMLENLKKEKDIFYVGTADPYYNKEIYNELRIIAEVKEFPGLGHSFEKNNDIIQSIEGLKRVIEEIKKDI